MHLVPLELGKQPFRLGVPKGSIFAEQMRAPENHAQLERFSRELTGQAVKIVFEEVDPHSALSLAKYEERRSRQNDEELRRQAVTHPSVQQAIRILGAQVTQVRPPKEPES